MPESNWRPKGFRNLGMITRPEVRAAIVKPSKCLRSHCYAQLPHSDSCAVQQKVHVCSVILVDFRKVKHSKML